MENFFKACIESTFTNENLNMLWLNRQSKQDIIGLETDLPIRYKLNDKGTRNIELMLESQFGFYYKTMALVEDTNILFPRQFEALTTQINFKGFKKYAMKNEDVEEYKSNDGKLELVKAFDGTMQTFVKTEDSFAMSSFSLTSGMFSSELDNEAVSSFNFTNGNSGIYPTKNSHQWLDRLAPQRLLEIFTIEQM